MLVVNLYGGPGSGKSTTAAYVFSILKMRGKKAELATEVAKDWVWEERPLTHEHQFVLLSKQLRKLQRVDGKVDVVITDSPLLLSLVYGDLEYYPYLKDMVLHEHKRYTTVDVWVKRTKEYVNAGRLQSEDEARALDKRIATVWENYTNEDYVINGNQAGAVTLSRDILEEVKSPYLQFGMTRKMVAQKADDMLLEKFLNSPEVKEEMVKHIYEQCLRNTDV